MLIEGAKMSTEVNGIEPEVKKESNIRTHRA